MTPTKPGGYLRVPEPEATEIRCPKCGAENIGRKVYVWRVSDERGLHLECDVCAHSWAT